MAAHPGFMLVWLFVLGAIIGSFLNVVIYRLPRKLSLLFPGSHCPNCQHAIRWYDNVPILSWLWLGQRCRDCKSFISGRYPLIEVVVGLLFVLFGWTDWAVPERLAIQQFRQVQLIDPVVEDAEIVVPNAEFFPIRMAYHLLLVLPLLAAALIDYDGQKLPRQLITWPCGGGILLAIFWSEAHLQALVWPHWGDFVGALGMAMLGLVAAAMLRIGTQDIFGPLRTKEFGLRNATLAVYAVGAFLGWIAVIVVGNLIMFWSFATQNPALKQKLGQFKPMALVFLVSVIWCAVEGPIARWFFPS